MAFDADSIIAVANELKEAQERVRQLEAKLRSMGVGQNTGAPKGLDVSKSVLAQTSLSDRVLNLFKVNPDTDFDFESVLNYVKAENPAYLRSVLWRLNKEERIETRGWGKYGAFRKNEERPKAKFSI